jgi:hypothetical protein
MSAIKNRHAMAAWSSEIVLASGVMDREIESRQGKGFFGRESYGNLEKS